MKLCNLCKKPIFDDKRDDTKYCDDYCKDLAYKIRKEMITYDKAKKLLKRRRKGVSIKKKRYK